MTKKSRDLSEHPTFMHTPSAWINVSILCVWIPISRGSLSKGAYGIKSEVDGPSGWKWTIARKLMLSLKMTVQFIQNVPNDSYQTIEFFRTVHIHSKLLSSLYVNHRPVSVSFFVSLPTVWFQDRPLSLSPQFYVPRTLYLDPWSSNFSFNTLAIWPKIELTIPIENELGGWVTLIKIVIIVRANN